MLPIPRFGIDKNGQDLGTAITNYYY